jgi:hypothetical protein
VLPNSLTHNSRLAVINGETLFQQNGSDVGCEAIYALFEFSRTGKSEIVGVPRIRRASGMRQRRQAAVHSVRAEVGKQWRSGGALREMRP